MPNNKGSNIFQYEYLKQFKYITLYFKSEFACFNFSTLDDFYTFKFNSENPSFPFI